MQNSIKLLINSIEWPVSYKLSPYNPKSWLQSWTLDFTSFIWKSNLEHWKYRTLVFSPSRWNFIKLVLYWIMKWPTTIKSEDSQQSKPFYPLLFDKRTRNTKNTGQEY
jgi:hypothetical protein